MRVVDRGTIESRFKGIPLGAYVNVETADSQREFPSVGASLLSAKERAKAYRANLIFACDVAEGAGGGGRGRGPRDSSLFP